MSVASIKQPVPKEELTPAKVVAFKTAKNGDGADVEMFLHVFEPEGHTAESRLPVVVFFFGGGWVNGEPRALFPHCDYFASRGIVAISAHYRTASKEGTTPFACAPDGRSAIRYVRAHAAELGIHPDKIVAIGSSAGGHVAAGTALLLDQDDPSDDLSFSCRPDAMVLYNPVVDTSENGYGAERLGDRWREISPTHHVRPGLPPTLIIHGTADHVVPYTNATDFTAKMIAAGNHCELVTLEGIAHGFAYGLLSPAGNRALRETDRFLVELGYLHGEPTLVRVDE